MEQTERPLVSIIIVTFNAREYVQKCLASVREMTRTTPHELIVIDNASREETREYLRGESGFKLVLNDENLLWCRACCS